MPEVVGRRLELDGVESFIRDVQLGPACLAIRGEAGIGKTTLLRRAIERCREHGFEVLSARCAEEDMPLSARHRAEPGAAHAHRAAGRGVGRGRHEEQGDRRGDVREHRDGRVEAHLTRIYRKLEFSTRGEAAAYAVRTLGSE